MILRKNKANASKLGDFQKFAIDFMEFDDIIHLETLDTKEKLLLKLEKGISDLKNEQKTCIELYYFDNRSYQDIADLMSIPIQNVKSHLQNGKRNLKLYLTNGKIE